METGNFILREYVQVFEGNKSWTCQESTFWANNISILINNINRLDGTSLIVLLRKEKSCLDFFL